MMSSSEMIVPKWNLREEEVEGEERKRSPHVQSHHHLIPNYVVPMCSDEVQELRWEKGQVGVHGVSEITNNPQRWSLESIVHQATSQSQSQSQSQQQKCMQLLEQSGSKRVMRCAAFPVVEDSGCASATREVTDTATMMTWNSFESPRSLKTAKIIADDDSVYHDCSENQDGERMTKEKSCRSQSSARRSRAAAIHNLSERRRRDRINEKMKALQKLVPNASKTDKASMLDEVIEYLKQLQAQVHMMSNARSNMPQMMMPLGMQQQLQMSLMARMGMGMGMGMGMLDPNNLTRNVVPPSAPFPPLMHAAAAAPLGGTTPFVAPPFTMPPMVPPPTPLKPNVDAADAYNTFLAQCMNMELLNKMSALYRQQSSSQQASKKADAQGSSFANSFAHST